MEILTLPRRFLVGSVAALLYLAVALGLLWRQNPALFVVTMMAALAYYHPVQLMVMEKRRSLRDIFKVSRMVNVILLLSALLFLAWPWQYQLYGRMVATEAVRWGAVAGAIAFCAIFVRRIVTRRRYRKNGQFDKLDRLDAAPKVMFHYLTIPLMTAMLVMTFWPQYFHRHWQLGVAMVCMAGVLLTLIIRYWRKKRRSGNKS